MSIKVYTDGACRGNPGPGGWGVLILLNNEEKELLEEWFRAFAQLLDLKNKKYNPMGYH